MITIWLAAMLMQEFSTPDGKPLYTWSQCQSYVNEAGKETENTWAIPEAVIRDTEVKVPLKPILYFWRLKMRGQDHGIGDWHLYNKEDRNFLLGASKQAQVEWTIVEGRLPL